MSQRKKTAAENLIQSLMDDLQDVPSSSTSDPMEKTVPVENVQQVEVKTSVGVKPTTRVTSMMPSMSSVEAQLLHAENLKTAQKRIIELEKESEKLREENEKLTSSADFFQTKLAELNAENLKHEKYRLEIKEQANLEINILRDNIRAKEAELVKSQQKVEELESRLASDLRKIRVRERELENRLELSRLERNAITSSKDATILELKKKIEQLEFDSQNYQKRCIELSKKIDENKEQFGRTVRALRLALTNLEVSENTGSLTIAPIKKAE